MAAAGERLVKCCISLDSTNAFNTIDRGTMLRALADTAPGLLPLARLMYNRAGRLVMPNKSWRPGEAAYKVFLSRCGARQGDPLGPVLFALGMMTAMREVQREHPEVHFPSFVDDIDALLTAKASEAGGKCNAVYITLRDKLATIGISFNSKTHLYCPSGETIHTALGITQARDGIATMGVPVGTAAFQLARARKRLANSFAQLELLPQVHFGHAMRILRFCISKRVAFLAGSLTPDVFRPLAEEWDAAVRKCLTCMFAGAPPHPRCFLAGGGGLDITVISEELSLLRVLSRAAARWTASARTCRASSSSRCRHHPRHTLCASRSRPPGTHSPLASPGQLASATRSRPPPPPRPPRATHARPRRHPPILRRP